MNISHSYRWLLVAALIPMVLAASSRAEDRVLKIGKAEQVGMSGPRLDRVNQILTEETKSGRDERVFGGEAGVALAQAAKAGDAWGLNNLGSMYEMGWGTTKDIAKAKEFYGQAAAKGNASAAANLKRLQSKGQ